MKVAFVGAGPRAVSQAEALMSAGLGDVVGVWNRSPERAHTLANSLPYASAHATVTEMVEATRPDVVSIVTHPAYRIRALRDAIDAGARTILLEKPIALTPQELAEVRAMGEECLIVVNTQYPWMTHWREIRRLVAEGALGEIRSIRASTGVDLFEQGPHLLSLALSTARAAGLPDPSWILAAGDGEASFGDLTVPAHTTAVADLGAARLQLLTGDVSPRVPGETNIFYQQQVEVTGSEGRVWVSLNQGWELWTSAGVRRGVSAWPRDDIQSQADLFRDLRSVVIDGGSPDAIPTRMSVAGADAALLFAWRESIDTGRMVML
ncbi:Gfo/Idh/MocA family protein [Microbacterium saperdae]|uniref:Putative dehydrogenase n=1 Tax=Microbacterium saperdae TaxID=69368 RepID=A0A543BIL5_9MICO|nr:Gfo/Idh/MocA family oxidoreductase [Microbacterium saperdae]TQL84699.1 putative dehydrogenase [Microbacterium saperdae]